MAKSYDHKKIEKKWQKKWKEQHLYRIPDSARGKKNLYALVEFAYPSGDLHAGHWYAFAVPDIYVRMKRMQGANVLYPMGFDAFGLPAENAAIKNKADPAKWTDSNIKRMRVQLESMGNAFDWEREVTTSDPAYYKWTQWLFLQLYSKGLAYKKKSLVNWDPVDKTVLANEQVLPDGTAERSGAEVEKKELEQWFLKITDYADRLIDDLELLDWPTPIKEAQKNWVGRSFGVEIDFLLDFKKNPKDNENRGPNGERAQLTVFTTRPDTLFGGTFLVLAPEHPWVTLAIDVNHDVLDNKKEVQVYVEEAKRKSELERLTGEKEKTGIELKGVKAINPATGEEISMWVADYVLGGYGTGAIMGVPAHDERDLTFAKKFDLPIRVVVKDEKDYSNIDPEKLRSLLKEIFNLSREEDFFMVLIGGMAGKLALSEELGKHSDIDVFVDKKGWNILQNYLGEKKGMESGSRDGTTDVHEWHNHLHFSGKGLWLDVFLLEQEEGIYVDHVGKDPLIWGDKSVFEERKIDGTKILIPSAVVQAKISQNLAKNWNRCHTTKGILTKSGQFDGLNTEEAKKKITDYVGGRMTKTYKLRDWLISRQRYWGAPIPIVYDPDGKAHPVPTEHLPWTLPTDVDFTPTGVAPLARSKELLKRTEKIFGKGWTPEADTMDVFVDSAWYYLRYLDPKNEKEFSSREKQKQWMPIARYSGGSEHTTVHVLYSRFFYKALHDLGLVTESEPYLRRMNRGIILAEDGRKMSKRWGNVINPDEQVENVGADALRVYLAFIGPYNEVGSFPWSTNGLIGVRRFLERVNVLSEKVSEEEASEDLSTLLNQTIKKVGDDIESMKFNTCVSHIMILANELQKRDNIPREAYKTLLKLLAPFAPHITEELWEDLGHTTSIHIEDWPAFDPGKLQKEEAVIAVQINGKVRGTILAPQGAGEDGVVRLIREDAKLGALIPSKPKRVVFVSGRVINFIP
jgi:leucyl-tRNA synthetase